MEDTGKVRLQDLLLPAVFFLSVLVLVVLLPTGTHIHTLWVYPELHSAMEMGCGLAAIMVSFFLFRVDKENEVTKQYLLACGFLGMGIFDLFHAVSKPGNSFVLTRSLSGLLGSLWFCLIWATPELKEYKKFLRKKVPWIEVALCVGSGLLILLYGESFAIMIEGGEFTATAVVLNTLSGILFIVSALGLSLDYYRSGRRKEPLFVAMASLLGIAGLIFFLSKTWCPHWWTWHVMRLVVSSLALAWVIGNHQRIVSDLAKTMLEREEARRKLRKAYEDVEGQVLKRTAELGFANEQLEKEIVERNKVEDELRKSQVLLKKTFASLDEAIFVVAPTTRIIIACNPAVERIFGYGEEEILGRSTELLHLNEAYYEEFGQALFSGLDADGIFGTEFRMKRKNGQVFFSEHAVTEILDDAGQRMAMVSVVRDISKRKQAEEVLRKSEERFRIIFECAAIGVALVNPAGRFLRCNPAFCRILGYSEAELCELTCSDVTYSEDAPADAAQFKDILNGKEKHVEHEEQYVCKYGNRIWVNLTACLAPLELGDIPLAIVLMVIDITERKRMVEALRESERRFRAIFNQTFQFAGLLSPDGTLLEINQTALEFIGFKSPEVVGRPFEETPWWSISTETQSRLKEAIVQAAKGEFIRYEVELLGAGNRVSTIDFSLKPITDETGQVVMLIPEGRDITKRKEAEEERRRLEQRLQQAQKAESLSRMAGAIAHNFNNMLAAVIGNLELVLDDLPRESQLRKGITAAMKASHRAAEISRFMLTYLGQTAGKKEPIDLTKTLRDTHSLMSASLPKNAHLKIELPPYCAIVLADGAHLKQVLTNLVSNAVEAIGEQEGSITLAIRVVETNEIREVRLLPLDWKPKSESYACLSVSDTGCGLDESSQEKIFDPFFSTKFTGRGLGLSVVLGLVRAHEGAISVESKAGQGAVFKVFLPFLAQEDLPDQKEAIPVFCPAVDGDLVLVVDDEPMVLNVAEAMLKQLFGYEVVTACNGSEAVEIFRKRKAEISLVMLDLSMPEMNGWETLETLRALRPDIPVVLASGYDEAQVMQYDRPEQPQAFLHKPYHVADLKAALGFVQKMKTGWVQ